MLTEQEKKELNYDKLSKTTKDKIDSAFISPDFIVAQTYYSQIKALSEEIIKNPFTIRGGLEEENSRQNVETALKVLSQLDSLNDKLKAIQQTLTIEEVNSLDKSIVTHKDVRNFALERK